MVIFSAGSAVIASVETANSKKQAHDHAGTFVNRVRKFQPNQTNKVNL